LHLKWCLDLIFFYFYFSLGTLHTDHEFLQRRQNGCLCYLVIHLFSQSTHFPSIWLNFWILLLSSPLWGFCS
jgi:hypothetical protein